MSISNAALFLLFVLCSTPAWCWAHYSALAVLTAAAVVVSQSGITCNSVTPPAVLPPAVLPQVIILQFMICLVEALIIGNKILAWRVFVSLSTEWNVSIPVLRENLALLLHENFIYRVRLFQDISLWSIYNIPAVGSMPLEAVSEHPLNSWHWDITVLLTWLVPV